MNILALDASTSLATVALMVNGVIFQQDEPGQQHHARVLLPMIESVCQEAQVDLNQLDKIIYGCGPGSFTGLRIACSIAKGLACALNIPLVPVSTLASIAETAFSRFKEASAVLAMLDARMQQVYWGLFKSSQATCKEHVSSASCIHIPGDGPILLAGIGFEPYFNQLPENLRRRFSTPHIIYPTARAMLHLSLHAALQETSAENASVCYIRDQIISGGNSG